jgi:hypothetical protein
MTEGLMRGSDTVDCRNAPSILLIHPPVAKPSEPPAGIARLAGALQTHNVSYSLIDANLEGMLYLLREPPVQKDTWTVRARRNLPSHLAGLRSRPLFQNIDRYRRAVNDVNRLLAAAGQGYHGSPGLCDFTGSHLSPVRSRDLLMSAEHPEQNPFYRYMEESLWPRIEAGQNDLVGISLSYLSQALTGFSMAGFVKRHFPHKRIIMGGSLITSWRKTAEWTTIFSGLIDRFVEGPGEEPLLDLLGAPCNDRAFYPPVYDGFPCGEYLSPGFVLPYASSSGCYWARCSFCPERAEGNTYAPIPATIAAGQLAALAAHMEPALIHLVDNAVSPAMLKALVDRPPGAPWYGFVRITRELTDLQFCHALRRSGCVMLKLGIESGDQNVLDYLDKGTTVEMCSVALKTLHAAGISTYVYLLFGTPPETRIEAERTLAFTVTHQECIDFLNLAIFNLPINSPETAGLSTAGFYDGDLPLYTDFHHPAGWGRREVRLFLDREFRRNPAVAAILRGQPPFFTSNHAPFCALQRFTLKAGDAVSGNWSCLPPAP